MIQTDDSTVCDILFIVYYCCYYFIIVVTIIMINIISFLFYCVGDNSSVVVSHLSETGLITAQINTHNETYYIEVYNPSSIAG